MKKIGLVFVLLVAGCLAGCMAPVSVDGTVFDASDNVGLYSLKPLDPLYISLLGIPEEKVLQTTIDENGLITIPYIDEPVQAAGLSLSGLEREIQRIYTEGQIYRNVTVNIQTDAKSYFMEGEVNRPQEYPLNRRITLLQAIAAASGYTEYADKKDITIIRHGEIIKVNGKELEKNPDRDIPIESGDRIKVDRTFY
jgi:polysaccharide export outer membrane protein